MKNIMRIFLRDIKTARRDSMALLIAIMPILLAVGIVLFAPGLNDTAVSLALLKDDEPAHIEYMERFAKVSLFDSRADAIIRVEKRDDTAAIVQTDGGYEIILQGIEPDMVESYAVSLSALYELGSTVEDSSASLYSLGRTVSPVKTMLVNMLISWTIMLAGMLIAISIVGEKADNTISAVNVTPVSQMQFVLGKTLLGGTIAMASIIAALLITGYFDINWLMIILLGISSMALSLIIGFIQGLVSDDVIEAASNVKMIMVPVAGSIIGYELLAANWQWTMYWSPFYWAYKANQLVLSKMADWPTVLLCTGMVLVLTFVVFLAAKPKIRAGLS